MSRTIAESRPDPINRVAETFRALLGKSIADANVAAANRVKELTDEELGLASDASAALEFAARLERAGRQRGKAGKK